MFNQIKIFLFLTLGVSFIYPFAVTVVSQTLMNDKANGSLLLQNGEVIASSLIGQNYTSDQWFHGRPSAIEYKSEGSGATNLGPISKTLKSNIDERKKLGLKDEMLFASGSGLDPHISKASALAQIPRIIEVRKLKNSDAKILENLINENYQERSFGFIGEAVVNIVTLNKALSEAHFE